MFNSPFVTFNSDFFSRCYLKALNLSNMNLNLHFKLLHFRSVLTVKFIVLLFPSCCILVLMVDFVISGFELIVLLLELLELTVAVFKTAFVRLKFALVGLALHSVSLEFHFKALLTRIIMHLY
jgi:hypothetical protein